MSVSFFYLCKQQWWDRGSKWRTAFSCVAHLLLSATLKLFIIFATGITLSSARQVFAPNLKSPLMYCRCYPCLQPPKSRAEQNR